MSNKQPLPTGLQLTALDQVFSECPHAYLDRLRDEDPLHRDPELGLFLTRLADVKALLANRALSSDPRKAPAGSYHRRSVLGKMPPEDYEPSMLHLDDPDHRRLRGLVNLAFNQSSVDALRPRLRAIAESLLDSIAGRDSFDVIAAYATPFPIMAIAEILGVDPHEIEQFKRWSDARAQIFNPARSAAQSAELARALQGLNDYFAQAAQTRRGTSDGTDLISALVSAEESGDRLTQREIARTCNLLLVAGNLTTTDLIGNGVLALLRHPDQLAHMQAHPELISNAIEEILRFDPPISQTVRSALQTVTIGAMQLYEGETAVVSLLAAGHDPAVHSTPHRFDVTRKNPSHAAFGGGAHFCLGAPLARAEAQIAIPLLFERFPGLRIDPQHLIEHKRVPSFNGLRALWVCTA